MKRERIDKTAIQLLLKTLTTPAGLGKERRKTPKWHSNSQVEHKLRNISTQHTKDWTI